jgi:hypothetical protein
MALTMRPLLRMSVSQVGFQPAVCVAAIVFDRELTTFVFHERWRDFYFKCKEERVDCSFTYWTLPLWAASVVVAVAADGLLLACCRRYGRRYCKLPPLS